MNDELKEILEKELLENNNFILNALVHSDANAIKEILKNKGFSCETSELEESEIKSFLDEVLLENMDDDPFVDWLLAGSNEQATHKRKRDDELSTSSSKRCWSPSLIHLEAAIKGRYYYRVKYLLENDLVNVQPDAGDTSQLKQMREILGAAFDTFCYNDWYGYSEELEEQGLPKEAIFDILLYYGADINLIFPEDQYSGRTVFHREVHVLAEGLGEGIHIYEENPALTGYPDEEDCRELEEYTEIADYFLSKGANINKRNMYGDTPLLAILWDFTVWPLIKYLLAKGANPDMKTKGADPCIGTKMGQTAFHRTIELLTQSINHDFDRTKFPKNPDVYLKEIITIFLSYKANLNAQDKKGNTPLHLAIYAYDAYRKYQETFDTDNTSDSDDTSDTGNIFYPVSISFEEILKIFIQHNANVNLQDENGNTPLHLIINYYNSRIDNINRNEESLGDEQRKQIIVPLLKEQQQIITAFLDANADINLTNYSGKSPLQDGSKSVALKAALLKEDWVTHTPNYNSFFQWLPNEMTEDVVNLMFSSALGK